MNSFASAALESLTPSQRTFLEKLPKAELHAHLNGSIPLQTLRKLASTYSPPSSSALEAEKVLHGVEQLNNFEMNDFHDFFALFPAIYALTSSRENLAIAARDVLASFLTSPAQCAYLELRTTPKETSEMTREDYVSVVLDEVEKYPADQAALILSLDRTMSDEVMWDVLRIAKKMRGEGRRVVGMDLCGDPTARDVKDFEAVFKAVKEAGLGLTLHVSETIANSSEETLQLLSYSPDRLGHATFVSESAEAVAVVEKGKMCVEICLSSNFICKTAPTVQDHHVRRWLKKDHPVTICTDDVLPFRTTLLAEYAILMAPPPLGLGMNEDEVSKIAAEGFKQCFK